MHINKQLDVVICSAESVGGSNLTDYGGDNLTAGSYGDGILKAGSIGGSSLTAGSNGGMQWSHCWE